MLSVRHRRTPRTCWNLAITVSNLDLRVTKSGRTGKVAVHRAELPDDRGRRDHVKAGRPRRPDEPVRLTGPGAVLTVCGRRPTDQARLARPVRDTARPAGQLDIPRPRPVTDTLDE